MALTLDERQRAMLLEMGVRVWLPGTVFETEPPSVAVQVAAPAAAQPAAVVAPKAQPALAPAPTKPVSKVNPHKLQKAEALVADLEAKLAGIDSQLADPKVYGNAGRVAELGREQAALRSKLETAEADLLALYD